MNPGSDTAGHGSTPVRYDAVTASGLAGCEWCGASFARSGRRRFDSDACRQASYRARRAAMTDATPPGVMTKPDDTVYECPSCEQRFLGNRRCDTCNLFCRRVGRGGLCPHCDEVITESDLRA